MTIWQGTPDEFLQWLGREKRRIICFGAADMGKELLREPAFRERVDFFVDNDSRKQGQMLESRIPVQAPEMLRKEDLTHKVLLITSGWHREIVRQLSVWPELAEVPCAVYPLLLSECRPGSEEFFRRRIQDECLREYSSALERRGVTDSGQRQALLDAERAYIEGDAQRNRPLVLPRMMILPTTRCNLRCMGCSSLLPLFEHPSDVPVEQILKDLDLVFRGVDQCVRLTIGGEPFLYPALQELLEALRKQEKILSVLLITNSTIQPSQQILDILCDPKFFVEISDYGHIRSMSRTVAALEEAGVRFCVLTDQIWDDMGGVQPRSRTTEQKREIYMNCEQGRLMKSIHNGAMYVCARSARLHALNCGYSSEQDYFTISETDSPGELQMKIRGLYERDCADACDYCDLGCLPGKKIPAGVQMAGTQKKSAYTLVLREEYEALKAAKHKT